MPRNMVIGKLKYLLNSSGLIGILPDSTAGLLRFKCVLTLIVVLMMVSALKPD